MAFWVITRLIVFIDRRLGTALALIDLEDGTNMCFETSPYKHNTQGNNQKKKQD